MSILLIPQETLLHVVSYLRTRDIVSLAQTFSRRITPICLPALSEWLPVARNERKMIDTFGFPQSWDSNGYCKTYYASKSYEQSDELGVFSLPPDEPVKRLHVFGYLNLNGDLHWLLPLDELSSDWMAPYQEGSEPAISPDQMLELEKACSKLELTLPKGFRHFMTNLDLQKRVPSASECYWTFEPFVKLKSVEKPSLDGYAMKIYADPQECWFWYLYMDRGGGHCILANTHDFRSFNDYDLRMRRVNNSEHADPLSANMKQCHLTWMRDLTQIEIDLGMTVAVAERFGAKLLFSTSWEEFLVRTYYEEWAFICSEDHPMGSEVPGPLKEYLVRVYSEEGRNLLD